MIYVSDQGSLNDDLKTGEWPKVKFKKCLFISEDQKPTLPKTSSDESESENESMGCGAKAELNTSRISSSTCMTSVVIEHEDSMEDGFVTVQRGRRSRGQAVKAEWGMQSSAKPVKSPCQMASEIQVYSKSLHTCNTMDRTTSAITIP